MLVCGQHLIYNWHLQELQYGNSYKYLSKKKSSYFLPAKLVITMPNTIPNIATVTIRPIHVVEIDVIAVLTSIDAVAAVVAAPYL